jgi:microsomal dipeptidase-like Zn-dependent dipeptidase
MKKLFQLTIVLIIGILFALFITTEKDIEDSKEVVVSDTDVTARLWNPRGKSDELIAERARFLAKAAETRTVKEKEADKVYMERYKDAIVINSLMPTSVGIIGNTIKSFTDGVERNRRAGVTHVSASVGAFHPEQMMYGFIRDTDPVVIKLDLTKVRTTQDIRDAKSENRMTIMYNSQGFDDKMKDLSYVGSLHDKGVNIMNFVYNTENHLATGINFNSDPNNIKGITELGKAFINLANERGIIVDVSHSSDAAAIDAAKVSTKPILASHNNSSTIFNNPRNMSDEGIRAIGKTGGAVCVNGIGVFLSEDANAQAETIAEHVQHIADLIGKQGTCYGSDFTHNLEDAMFIQVPMVDQYPPEKGFGAPSQMASIEDIWAIVAVLEDKYQWNEGEIRGFLGENLLRVYEANWE